MFVHALRAWDRRRSALLQYSFGAGIFLVLVIILGTNVRERVSLLVFPSAERAYAYGEIHFDAGRSGEYDIDRAEYFFNKALALDPSRPYVRHQLARIAFLRGDFRNALWNINRELETNPSPSPSSFYMRGLVGGYMGAYDGSAKDYERYLQSDPNNWAAINDYAWVLLKARRFADAFEATQRGLAYFPDNPWLLNSSATALYELGRYAEALAQVQAAHAAVSGLSQQQWLIAYPGNDPQIAARGVEAFKKAVEDNMHTIVMKVASSAVQ